MTTSTSRKIGPYEVVKSIGRGSFGIVTAVKNAQGEIFVVKQLDMSCMNHKEKMNVVNELRWKKKNKKARGKRGKKKKKKKSNNNSNNDSNNNSNSNSHNHYTKRGL
ncbi:hypothetical protein PVBG_01723 [Plasmodium vivax Brazil I]|uniref:Protein kinase domain-containing protein n=1 Tax=Plasmodium vivax (strain Brazil I) TaxID=1033975 RepID=A0A0J9STH9_PLAV1|nr:hypothetical protein PVBG_01723 [Plasmodium vivax Brazil I]